MASSALEAFVEEARQDAGLQAQVAHAISQDNAAHALLQVARTAGFDVPEDELTASLTGAMSDDALEHVVGGYAPTEFFAEAFRKLGKSGEVQGR